MSLLQRLFSTSLNRLCRTPLLFAADRILRAREVTENVFSHEGRVSEERLKRVIQTNRFFRIPWYTFFSHVAIFRKETALTRIVTLKRARFKTGHRAAVV